MAKKGKKMSAALKGFLKKHGRFPRKGELRAGSKARASHAGGHKTKRTGSSAHSSRSSGHSSGGRSRMAKKEPIPIIGVKGSETAISAPKALVAVGVTAPAILDSAARSGVSPIDVLTGKYSDAVYNGAGGAVRLWWDGVRREIATPRGKLAILALGGMIVFGKKIDQRFRGLPVKFGK